VFRNPLAIYRLNEPCPAGQSPFDLELGVSGDAFAIHAMHFKLGLYEHQSAGAIQAIVDACAASSELARDLSRIRAIRVKIYEPAYSIIADPAKRTPSTRQSADHSLPYILAKTLLKARGAAAAGETVNWESLMLLPEDYSEAAIGDADVRHLIERIVIEHGGTEYDALYPDGIPTSVEIEHESLGRLGGELVRYPLGHARSDAGRTAKVVALKFDRLVTGAVDDPAQLRERLRVAGRSPEEIAELYAFPIHGCDPG
jgi:2-methylcitrate dehydratase